MVRFLATPLIVVLLLLTNNAQHSAYGQHVFHFVEDFTGDVFASLELSTLPATEVSHIVDLSFTAAGDAFYGFGEGTYPGIFDYIGTDLYSDDGMMSLDVASEGVLINFDNDSAGLIVDRDAPAIGVLAGATDPVVSLYIPQGTGSSDILFINVDDARQRGGRTGKWLVVPETNTGCSLLVAILLQMSLRKRSLKGMESQLLVVAS